MRDPTGMLVKRWGVRRWGVGGGGWITMMAMNQINKRSDFYRLRDLETICFKVLQDLGTTVR